MNKLAISLALATTTFSASAFAYDKLSPFDEPTPDTVSDTKLEILKDMTVLDTLMKSEEGQNIVKHLHADEPIIDTMDPGARCDDISAGKKFSVPLYSTEIAGVGARFALTGGIGIVADANSMGAEASFGPTMRVLGVDTKPLELKLSATTNSMGENSVNLKVLAFTYELDSYNIANSTSALEYSNSVQWSLPNAVSGTLGDSYDCNWIPLLDDCSVSWAATPLLARVSGIFVLRVNHQGVAAHALAAAASYSTVRVSGSAEAFDQPITATGTGAINYMRGNFYANATLAPHDNRWVATADASINVEDVFGAKVTAQFPEVDPFTVYEKAPVSFSDAWAYSCTFDKKWK